MASGRAKALVPLLTLLGTTAAAAVVARKYGPELLAARYRRRMARAMRDADHAQRNEGEVDSAQLTTAEEAAATNVDDALPKPSSTTTSAAAGDADVADPRPPSTLLIALLLQDGYLMLSFFGLCVMVLVVLVSLALVALDKDLTSPSELQLFSPMMFAAMALIATGMIHAMLVPRRQRHPRSVTSHSISAYASKAPGLGQGDVAVVESKSETHHQSKADQQLPEKRVSRCPFGFG